MIIDVEGTTFPHSLQTVLWLANRMRPCDARVSTDLPFVSLMKLSYQSYSFVITFCTAQQRPYPEKLQHAGCIPEWTREEEIM